LVDHAHATTLLPFLLLCRQALNAKDRIPPMNKPTATTDGNGGGPSTTGGAVTAQPPG
jgi:hypothetical protein